MQQGSSILGLDIGSVTIAMVVLDESGDISHSDYRSHQGEVDKALTDMLAGVDVATVGRVAATSSSPAHVQSHARCDTRIAVTRAARQLYHRIGAILMVGGEKFGLLRFDPQGQYLGYRTNTTCAAGTGSFLDQQAKRLQFSGMEELAMWAARHQGPPLKIASRCAVFAKTDLIHAQQEGHDVAAICDGLCYGLAENIYDALFAGDIVAGPIVMCGGVAKNPVVVRHLGALIGVPLEVHPQAHLFGALGAALTLLDAPAVQSAGPKTLDDILTVNKTDRHYAYGPLALHMSDYPDFDAGEHYDVNFQVREDTHRDQHSTKAQVEAPTKTRVEVDVYGTLTRHQDYPVCLGIDIGSTSTKAVVIDSDQQVLAGFYTRTAGKPLAAVQAILRALDDLQQRKCATITILGAGTTGSGRKFIGALIDADLVMDEISAHARAACALHPDADTIIEIGGQDAKFTTLDNGAVTFAVMNTVCAAGTGSFIEEQAQQLNCPLTDFTHRTLKQKSPMASDRCTVFMERDLHHYLSEGYTVEEVLTAVLHSVRENYLTKVAVEGMIGRKVLFQGATAKNKALVAAFEQRLNQPVHVSRYCHLTGALGVALMLAEQEIGRTAFRGIDFWRKTIPLQREVCELCTNHCKLTVATIDGQRVAYGFSCGRDYETKRYVHRNPSGFDLIRERRRAFALPSEVATKNGPVIGIPAALYLYEDLEFWQVFFKGLGFQVTDSRDFNQGITIGRRAAGPQFCAPIAALHGHVKYLQDHCDALFLPYYLETKSGDRNVRRQYCYYTQFSVPLAATIVGGRRCRRILSPLVHYLYNSFHTKIQLYKSLKALEPGAITFKAVAAAYDRAQAFKQQALATMHHRFEQACPSPSSQEIYAVLLGRPYTILSPAMNKGIPDIFAGLGVKTFYQEMIGDAPAGKPTATPLLKELHWHHAAAVLARAEQVGHMPGAYPVLITSFKCSPDAFVIDYFKQTMATFGKPYLILQVDDHDARGGYETRIEAAVRAFRNHFRHTEKGDTGSAGQAGASAMPAKKKFPSGKTLLLPNWDDLTIPLIATALRREGIDARVLEHHPDIVQRSLRFNTGQCIPVNIIAQECIEYITAHDLNPGQTLLWMPAANIACNIHLYPAYIHQALQSLGKGKERAGVHVGPMSMSDLNMKMPLRAYFAYMFGGYLRRMGCRTRPYEEMPGRTDQAMTQSMALLHSVFEGQADYEQTLAKIAGLFKEIPVSPRSRPKVAIFGDLYARDNAAINQDLIPFIEANGGEVLTTPYSDYLKMIARSYLRKWMIEGHYLEALSSKLILATLKVRESAYRRYFEEILQEPEPVYNDVPAKILAHYHLRPENTGESMDNLLKIHYLTKHHPEIALLVQVSPAFCCPALVTEAMARKIEQSTGIPMVSITYDGTGGNKNDAIIPYLAYWHAGRREFRATL